MEILIVIMDIFAYLEKALEDLEGKLSNYCATKFGLQFFIPKQKISIIYEIKGDVMIFKGNAIKKVEKLNWIFFNELDAALILDGPVVGKGEYK